MEFRRKDNVSPPISIRGNSVGAKNFSPVIGISTKIYNKKIAKNLHVQVNEGKHGYQKTGFRLGSGVMG